MKYAAFMGANTAQKNLLLKLFAIQLKGVIRTWELRRLPNVFTATIDTYRDINRLKAIM